MTLFGIRLSFLPEFTALLAAAITLIAAAPPPAPEISTRDVDTFYRVYDAAHGHPEADQLQTAYLDAGSPGLRKFALEKSVNGEKLAAAIARSPGKYDQARQCAKVLPGVRRRLTVAFAKLAGLDPTATFPPVTIVIGRGSTGGTTNSDGVVIGLETVCSADYMDPDLEARFVHLIAHKYAHVQQPAAQTEPVAPTVLFASLIEGGAEFVAELISGDVGNYQLKNWTTGKEVQIERYFARSANSTDVSKWLWAGPGDESHPGDLGYWVGHRIVRTFYIKAPDKRVALNAILGINQANAQAFLRASGWVPTANADGTSIDDANGARQSSKMGN